MARNCDSCGKGLEPGDLFCENCGTSVSAKRSPVQAARSELTMLSRFERAVYFRIARGFAWVLAVFALAGFFFSLVLALQSVGELVGTRRSVSQEEVQASIAYARVGRGNHVSQGEDTTTDPRLIGEYETALAELVNLIPPVKRQGTGDDAIRNNLRGLFSPLGKDIAERILVAREAKDVLQGFPAMDLDDALSHFAKVKLQKDQEAERRKEEATKKSFYLGGAMISTAILITLVSMILVLLAIERNTHTVK